MILRLGDHGQAVREMQIALDEVGHPLDPDGRYGMLTRNAVVAFQRAHGLRQTGIADVLTQSVIMAEAAKTDGTARISKRGIKLILDYEVGGGKHYYEFLLSHPTVPPAESGVTIGIGFDLGYEVMQPWEGKLTERDFRRLSACVGATGARARRLLPSVSDINIPWKSAYEVFEDYTLPRELEKTVKAFPGMEKLHPDVQSALVSLVFNRGTSMNGDKRAEMREVRRCVEAGDIKGIADALRKMKRLWPDIKGLRVRRDAEAALVESHVTRNTGIA